MPLGKNIGFEFFTNQTQGDKKTYAFDSSNLIKETFGYFDAYGGSFGDADLYISCFFGASPDDPNTGDFNLKSDISTGDFNLHSPDQIYSCSDFVECDSYHGAYVNFNFYEVEDLGSPLDGYGGAYGDSELETFLPPIFGDIDGYHGGYGDVVLSATFNLPADAYGGAYGDSDLTTTFNLPADAYGGGYGDSDLETSPPKTFDGDAYTGSNIEIDVATQFLFNVRGYGGSYGEDTNLETFPSQEISSDFYSGATLEDVDLQEYDGWYNTLADFGAYAEVAEFNTTVSIQPVADFGHNTEVELDVQPAADAYGGSFADTDFTNIPGETLTIDGYHGSYAESDSDIRIHAQFVPHPIVASQTMFDGFGGVGGLNHCVSKNLSAYGDTAIRFPYSNLWDGLNVDIPEDNLDIEFADYGDRPWNVCSDNHIVFEVDLLIRPRFDFDEMSHGSNMKVFIPKEYMALCDETPEEFLQRDNFGATDIPENADWYTNCCYPEFGDGVETSLFFEPIQYIRFCPGYIRPNGNSVLFEFDSTINEDCLLYYAIGGEHLFCELSVTHGYSAGNYNGAHMSTTLSTEDSIILRAYHGHYADVDNPVMTPKVNEHGSNMFFDFYEPPIDSYAGQSCEFDDLIVPGPGIEWLTEEGCLPNDFFPINESGDIDFIAIAADKYNELYPPSAVENRNYRYFLDAVCAAFDFSE